MVSFMGTTLEDAGRELGIDLTRIRESKSLADWEVILYCGITDQEWSGLPEGDKMDLRILADREVDTGAGIW